MNLALCWIAFGRFPRVAARAEWEPADRSPAPAPRDVDDLADYVTNSESWERALLESEPPPAGGVE